MPLIYVLERGQVLHSHIHALRKGSSGAGPFLCVSGAIFFKLGAGS